MNQLHSAVQIESVAPVAARDIPAGPCNPRLVVVLREVEEEALLAGRIQELARDRGLTVLLLGIVRDSKSEATLRRGLVTIAAFIKEANARTGLMVRPGTATGAPEIQIERGRAWIDKVRAMLKPEDLLACYSDEEAGIFERPLGDLLSSGLNVPVHMFAGLRVEGMRWQNRLEQAASWVGSLAAIGGFLLLQARIVIAFQGWLQSALLLVALLAEVGVVWAVNALIAQI